ncbi:uncharacterized protein [Triticum aestivum]|uniref:uncharacterized protein n=1 Tax=Triticum aestivum TaxID=4565 RepID=UPI001D0026BC|nr:uncharacterized protein LOC123083799 [Triticum aestivum]
MSHKPASALKTIPLIWPFAVWGLDMVGPLRTGRSGFTNVLVAVDKFTKWIEAKPIKNLDASTAVSFVKELTFRYGVPHSIITDNGSNFDSDEFRAFCASQGTRVDYASVAHPQSNGQAERANGLILKGLKPRLMRDLKHAAGAWVDELPLVLWGLRITPNWSTGQTPFFLVYGAEAVLPSDLLHNAPRGELFSEEEAEEARQDSVELLEEEREMALIRSTIYQQDLRRFHARNVSGRAFQEGDLVLRVDQQKPHNLDTAKEELDYITARAAEAVIGREARSAGHVEHEAKVAAEEEELAGWAESAREANSAGTGSPLIEGAVEESTEEESGDDDPLVTGRRRVLRRASFGKPVRHGRIEQQQEVQWESMRPTRAATAKKMVKTAVAKKKISAGNTTI